MSMLFRNRWFALLWLAMTVASASLFVGEDGGAAKLLDSAKQIRTQREQLQNVLPVSSQLVESETSDFTQPVLLPGGDLDADPHNAKPGDVFIDAVSARRVRIVGREASVTQVPTEAQ